MKRKRITDKQYDKLNQRVVEIVRRIYGRTLSYEVTMKVFQNLIDENTRPVYDAVIDYDRSLDEMIKAGKYDWPNPDINEKHFPVKGKGKHKQSIVLFHFDQNMKSKEVINKMNKQGYRPATIEELLALSEKYPNLQREFPIVALGSVWRGRRGHRGVPYLYWYSLERNLDLRWFGRRWSANDRFAAICK